MGNKLSVRFIVILVLTAFLTSVGPSLSIAEPSILDAKKLLEQSLTITEIDRELDRLAVQEEALLSKMEETRAVLARNEQAAAAKREHASSVLRAYYMGERDHLWLLLFSSRSFSEALAVLDYIAAIMEHDARLLRGYREAYRELVAVSEQQKQNQKEIEELRSLFIQERERLEAVNREVEAAMAQLSSDEREQQQKEMERVTMAWQNEGRPLFDQYFRTLSQLSMQFPQLLQKEKNSLKLDGFKLSVQLSDQSLNDFLREQDKSLENFSFTFADKQMIIEGANGDIEAKIEGKYVLDQDLIRFQIDRLYFNGLELPDNTARELEEQYQLTINPKLLMPTLEPASIQITPGKLVLQFTFG
ncbi:hypothetical protein [Paenibacillus turpanensis]|uniref:hypothetical protein n=1 Tax=Paenibacillus turpanensis TaxID=2689078 RepID=UPI00140E89A7|nr:hypothetical protein [Paenibacillus turpanensis]